MGATEEQMNLVAGSSMDHVAYILILFSLAFLMFIFASLLVTIYDRLTTTEEDKVVTNGYHSLGGGHSVEEGRARAAEEFELEGLTSDDEEDNNHDNTNGRRNRRSGEGHKAQTEGVVLQ